MAAIDDIKNTIICGDNIEVLAGFATGSVPTIITDPPYGWSFMGKGWDYKVPSVEQFEQMLRVLKPGGTMLCFGGSRSYHRMAINVEDAGFILKDCIMWLYGSGFPKATDISKQIDKQAGVEREVVGPKTYGDGKPCHYASEEAEAESEGKCQSGRTVHAPETKPATEEAMLWDGWKSHGLKPAYEPIIVAMKANEGSYANNALTHGVAGLNIDAGRIGTDEVIANHSRGAESAISKGKYGDSSAQETHQTTGQTLGRFPANVILDEQAAAMLDAQSGSNTVRRQEGRFLEYSGIVWYGDPGGASRFFYCAKASKSERNDGCGGLEAKEGGSMSANEGDSMDLGAASLTGEKVQRQQSKNHHPTVKPLALMEYLCKLTSTPTGGCVLDPFAGSGTTLLAAYNTGRDYIGIEMDPDYVKIIEARLAGARDKLGLFES